jgi:hypothetical protein
MRKSNRLISPSFTNYREICVNLCSGYLRLCDFTGYFFVLFVKFLGVLCIETDF